MRTNTPATLYNRYVVTATRSEAYQRTVLPEVAWENHKASNVVATGGRMFADQAKIFILMAFGKRFLKPAAWKALTSKTGHWTLQIGDVIVQGSVNDEITDTFTITDLKAKYDDVLTITSIDAMNFGSVNMRHWQVGAQ